jgi:sulfatase maturation enzyme AslB (radical SAM superfamily)
MTNKICGIPFKEIAFHYKEFIAAVPCCSSWLKPPYSLFINNVRESINGDINVMEYWNSKDMQIFRRSILDGTYRYCKVDVCPYLKYGTLPPVPDEAIPYIEKGTTHLGYPPLRINTSLDPACNLMCPSCRPAKMNKPNEKTYQRMISILASGTQHVFVNGSGEVFVNKYLMQVFQEFSCEKYPAIQQFSIITNGTAFNRTVWYSLSKDFKKSLHDINISIDSPIKKTYEKIRVGGNFENLMKNMEFIAQLRKENSIKLLIASFVLQRSNIEELPQIIDYAHSIHTDLLTLNKVEDWAVTTSANFNNKLALPPNWRIIYKNEINVAKDLIKNYGMQYISNVIPME